MGLLPFKKVLRTLPPGPRPHIRQTMRVLFGFCYAIFFLSSIHLIENLLLWIFTHCEVQAQQLVQNGNNLNYPHILKNFNQKCISTLQGFSYLTSDIFQRAPDGSCNELKIVRNRVNALYFKFFCGFREILSKEDWKLEIKTTYVCFFHFVSNESFILHTVASFLFYSLQVSQMNRLSRFSQLPNARRRTRVSDVAKWESSNRNAIKKTSVLKAQYYRLGQCVSNDSPR